MISYTQTSSPVALEIVTAVSNSASTSPFSNPVMLYVSAGSVSPNTFVSAKAVTVSVALVMLKSAPTKTMS